MGVGGVGGFQKSTVSRIPYSARPLYMWIITSNLLLRCTLLFWLDKGCRRQSFQLQTNHNMKPETARPPTANKQCAITPKHFRFCQHPAALLAGASQEHGAGPPLPIPRLHLHPCCMDVLRGAHAWPPKELAAAAGCCARLLHIASVFQGPGRMAWNKLQAPCTVSLYPALAPEDVYVISLHVPSGPPRCTGQAGVSSVCHVPGPLLRCAMLRCTTQPGLGWAAYAMCLGPCCAELRCVTRPRLG